MRNIDILIVGSGPSGMSTALHLVKLDPEWSNRIIVLDKSVHPREKLCGGGVTRFGVNVLSNLGLEFEPQHVVVNEIHIVFENEVFCLPEQPMLRITRRDEFDHWLVQCGERRGIEVHQGEAVNDVVPQAEDIKVVTESETYLAKVVVAADGASSFVKRRLKWGGESQTARLLEILTPEIAEDTFEFREGVAVFDFTPMMKGLQGYYWDFPSLIKGQPYMNRGVFDSRIRTEMPRIPLKEEFEFELSKRDRALSQYQLKGHPIHWFDTRAEFSRPHVLLVGDAAGTDPLFGEGIPFALAYGEVAASEIVKSFSERNFDFTNYKEQISEHRLLRQLSRRAWVARKLYKLPKYPWLARLMWKLTPLLFRFVAWYKPHYIPAENPRIFRRDVKRGTD
jgi:flavin-dependent dehydrogenase